MYHTSVYEALAYLMSIIISFQNQHKFVNDSCYFPVRGKAYPWKIDSSVVSGMFCCYELVQKSPFRFFSEV